MNSGVRIYIMSWISLARDSSLSLAEFGNSPYENNVKLVWMRDMGCYETVEQTEKIR